MKHRTVGIRDVHLHPYVFGHFKLSISWQRNTFVTICRFVGLKFYGMGIDMPVVLIYNSFVTFVLVIGKMVGNRNTDRHELTTATTKKSM